MIPRIKTPKQIEKMQVAGRITGEALLYAKEFIHEGVTTKEIDDKIRRYIEKCGAKPTFLGYGGFPGSACISINDEVIHGIPSYKRVLRNGDIVKIDVGAARNGFTGDSAATFAVGEISEEAQRLIDVTRESFYEAIKAIENTPNPIIMDIGKAVSAHAEANGFSVVRKYVGHGVGASLHEFPNVPNYPAIGDASSRIKIIPGMTLAIEPMINQGTRVVKEMPDGWTVVTGDGKLSAHYEHSIAVTDNGIIILTKVD